ncbi:MAG: DUF72 domain-containing protein [Gemmatimonadetes bacterium]|nr:DUF72 domain-containing protein [Gemmatimonadota bacterium]
MNAWVGTSGYAYKEWKGSFYPEDLPDAQMLHYYGGRLNSVEINNTFYRMPTKKLLQDWAAQVPDRFAFVLKASRKITHQKKLKDAQDEVGYLVRTASELEAKLGPILFQLPPYLKRDLPLLQEFLAQLPEDCRAALEFRSSSWFEDAVYDALRAHNVALVTADSDEEKLAPVIVPTASYGYARLRREDYDAKAMRAWAKKLAAPEWDDLYVFFKHEDAAAGPKLAEAFAGLLRT